MSRIIGTIILLIVAGYVVWLVFDTKNAPDDQINEHTTEETWESFRGVPFGGLRAISLRYPEEVEVSRPSEHIVTLKYIGPDSEPNTEITDGYFITIMTEATSSLESYIATRDTRSSVETIVFNGYDARRYQVDTELGTRATHTTFMPQQGTLVDVSVSAFGADAQGYRNTIEDILATLRIETNLVSDDEGMATTSIAIALLDTETTSQGKERGCDRVVMVSRTIEETEAPLTASLNELFSISDERVNGLYNFIAKTNDTLRFKSATIENGTASIYLTGEL